MVARTRGKRVYETKTYTVFSRLTSMNEKKIVTQLNLFGGVAYRKKYESVKKMELPKLEDRKLNPKYFGERVVLARIRLGTNGDTITSSERELKDGKGKFKQFTLFLEIEGEDVEICYLMLSDLRDISRVYGLNTSAWANRSINIHVLKEKEFFRWKLEPVESVV